jgi:hypothetical protein
MTEFAKAKIGFAVAFLAVLFTITPLISAFGDRGTTVFGLTVTVQHLYYFMAAALAVGVHSYGLQFVTERKFRALDVVGDACYAVGMLAPAAFLAVVLLVAAVSGIASVLPKVAPIASTIGSIASALVGLAAGIASSWLARGFRRLEQRSEARQLDSDAASFLARASELRRAGMPDLSLVEAYKALEVAVRRALVGKPLRGTRPDRPADTIRAASDLGLITDAQRPHLDRLRRWRNMAAHGLEPASDQQAAEALELVRQVVARLELEETDGPDRSEAA